MRTALRFVAVLAGIVALPSAITPQQQFPQRDYGKDPRLWQLRAFFKELDSPAYSLAEEFLVAADLHGLDWRLLPSISIVESGGGKAFMNNNILGWDSCRVRFPTLATGIHTVARRLSISNLYKNKSLSEKLEVYNPHPAYPARVTSLMERLESPSPPGPLPSDYFCR
ncbi:MAG: hypothetical protein EHM65_01600 [Acidobacteriales bacterium]|nr:MAG: hypothetical protein EHM65_01600 [Terriglobales bacterium]